MWYHVRYVCNLVLTAFLVIGLTLLIFGTVVLVLVGIGTVISITQNLLGFDPLLTPTRMYWLGVVVIGSCGLGTALSLLGLNATDPKFLKKQGLSASTAPLFTSPCRISNDY